MNHETLTAFHTMLAIAPVVVPAAILWTTGALTRLTRWDHRAALVKLATAQERTIRRESLVNQARIFYTLVHSAERRGDTARANAMRVQATAALVAARGLA